MEFDKLAAQIRDIDVVQRADSEAHHRRLNELEAGVKQLGDRRDFMVLQAQFAALKAEFDAFRREMVALVKTAQIDSKATEIANALSKVVLVTRQQTLAEQRQQHQEVRSISQVTDKPQAVTQAQAGPFTFPPKRNA
jgi:hypothetical protein